MGNIVGILPAEIPRPTFLYESCQPDARVVPRMAALSNRACFCRCVPHGPGFATCQTSEEQLELSFRAGQAALKQGEFVVPRKNQKVLALDPNLVEAEVNLASLTRACLNMT